MSKEEDEWKSLDDLNDAQKIFCEEDSEVIEISSDPLPENESVIEIHIHNSDPLPKNDYPVILSESDMVSTKESQNGSQEVILIDSGSEEEPFSEEQISKYEVYGSYHQDFLNNFTINLSGTDEEVATSTKSCQDDSQDVIILSSESDKDPSPQEESQEEELEHDEELVEYEGEKKKDSDNEETDLEEEPVTEDSDEQSTKENNESEDYVVKEIRKRREVSGRINTIQLDTALALDVKFSPTKLEIAILFSASLKLYAVEEGALTNIITADIRLPLTAIQFSSSGEDVYGVEGSIFHKFMRNDDNLTVQSIELFEKTITCIQVGATCAVVGSEEGIIYVVDPETCKLKISVNVADDAINCISIIGDIAYINSTYAVFAISLSNGTVLSKNDFPVGGMHGTIQGNSFVTASAKGELVLFSMPTLDLQGTFRVAKDATVSAMVSINSSHVAVAFDNSSIRLFSLFPNMEVGIIGVLNNFATQLSVSCDGKWLIANDFLDNCHMFSLADVDDTPPECKKADVDDAPPECQKRKRSSFSKNLTSSSSEDKEVFFSSLS